LFSKTTLYFSFSLYWQITHSLPRDIDVINLLDAYVNVNSYI